MLNNINHIVSEIIDLSCKLKYIIIIYLQQQQQQQQQQQRKTKSRFSFQGRTEEARWKKKITEICKNKF
jgi:hypothetical protein